MKKSILLILIILSLFSCKSSLVNYALEKRGVFDEEVKVVSFSNNEHNVVFIPMVHVSTKLFYDDVNTKIDSLKKLDYFFYFEKIKASGKNDTIIRKSMKLIELPVMKQGYKSLIDSILLKNKIKLKKEIIDQPKYEKFGLDSLNSKNVDLSMVEIINYYEKKYQPIILEPCDFENEIYEKPKCPLKLSKEINDDVVLNSRNMEVIKELSTETRKKIAIIYGKGHLVGIREELLKMGYVEETINK